MRPYPLAEAALRRLRGRFAKVSRGIDRRQRVRRQAWVAWLPAALVSGALTGYALTAPSSSGWGLFTTLRHLAAQPNCAAARAVGLAPARPGEPGYWPQHDRDGDGIACEPWPRR